MEGKMEGKLYNLAIALAEEVIRGRNLYIKVFNHNEIPGIPEGQCARVTVERIIPISSEERVTYPVPELAGV